MGDKHSFDIVGKIEVQEIDNAINQAMRDVTNRYDLKDANASIEFSQKDNVVTLSAQDDFKLKAVKDIFNQKLVKRQISLNGISYKPVEVTSQAARQKGDVQSGIPTDKAKKITAFIKSQGLKVQAQIMNEQVRVSGKKIDDLQTVMKALKQQNFDF